jgi:hypothetical protein
LSAGLAIPLAENVAFIPARFAGLFFAFNHFKTDLIKACSIDK